MISIIKESIHRKIMITSLSLPEIIHEDIIMGVMVMVFIIMNEMIMTFISGVEIMIMIHSSIYLLIVIP